MPHSIETAGMTAGFSAQVTFWRCQTADGRHLVCGAKPNLIWSACPDCGWPWEEHAALG
jgi:hypothetical protein